MLILDQDLHWWIRLWCWLNGWLRSNNIEDWWGIYQKVKNPVKKVWIRQKLLDLVETTKDKIWLWSEAKAVKDKKLADAVLKRIFRYYKKLDCHDLKYEFLWVEGIEDDLAGFIVRQGAKKATDLEDIVWVWFKVRVNSKLWDIICNKIFEKLQDKEEVHKFFTGVTYNFVTAVRRSGEHFENQTDMWRWIADYQTNPRFSNIVLDEKLYLTAKKYLAQNQ